MEELLCTPQSVELDHSPIAEEAVLIGLVIVVCHVLPALVGNYPPSVRRNLDAVVDCFAWSTSYFVSDSLRGVKPDRINRQLDHIDHLVDKDLAEESLEIC